MSHTDVQADLARFATAMIEQSGGMVDWDDDAEVATAMVPLDLAESLGQHDEAFAISMEPREDSLVLSLGGEFIDLASRTLKHFVPNVGTFTSQESPIRKTEFASAVEAAFGWQNARCRVIEGRPLLVPYHAWWFHVTLQSEETWESIVPITLNAKSGVQIDIGADLQSGSLKPSDEPVSGTDTTLHTAATIAQAKTLHDATAFFDRVDSRRKRDQKRLHDYYRAMRLETTESNRRAKVVPTKEEAAARVRVIELELQRKLAELDERYEFSAVLRPIALAEIHIPTVCIDIEIQRKAAKRIFRVYWNSILKKMEPMVCSGCHQPNWNFWFTNDTVAPFCGACHDARQS